MRNNNAAAATHHTKRDNVNKLNSEQQQVQSMSNRPIASLFLFRNDAKPIKDVCLIQNSGMTKERLFRWNAIDTRWRGRESRRYSVVDVQGSCWGRATMLGLFAKRANYADAVEQAKAPFGRLIVGLRTVKQLQRRPTTSANIPQDILQRSTSDKARLAALAILSLPRLSGNFLISSPSSLQRYTCTTECAQFARPKHDPSYLLVWAAQITSQSPYIAFLRWTLNAQPRQLALHQGQDIWRRSVRYGSNGVKTIAS
jgi:hypothetical protein